MDKLSPAKSSATSGSFPINAYHTRGNGREIQTHQKAGNSKAAIGGILTRQLAATQFSYAGEKGKNSTNSLLR
jgi:hypothetical protein